jgi:multiple sugar transport system substrate-binding protein
MLTRRDFTRLSLFSLGLGLANCAHVSGQPDINIGTTSETADLTIWWEQGFLPEENEKILQIIQQWEKLSEQKVSLKLMSVDGINQQLTQILVAPDEHQIPDIVYSVGVDSSLAPSLAWRDQLLDLSEVIAPIKDQYTSDALSQVFYRNQIQGERSYYALPLWQSDDYIHYWGSLLAQILHLSDLAGFSGALHR